MKNKFLLLGATALLSTGAIVANAANPTDDMKVNVELVVASQFKANGDLEFGRWNVPTGTKTVTLSMASNGVVTPSTGVTEIGSDTSDPGNTIGAPCDTLLFPETVYLSADSGYVKDLTSGPGTLTNLKATDGDGVEFACNVYGDLTIGDGSAEIRSSLYSGSFTITAVLGL